MIKSNTQLRIITAMVNTDAVVEVDIIADVNFNIETLTYLLRVQTYYIQNNNRMPLEQINVTLQQAEIEVQTGATFIEKIKKALVAYMNTSMLYGSENGTWILV